MSDESNAKTVAKIEAVALRMLEKEGAEKVSMRRIAKEVGITPMAIYYHFKDKSELLKTLAENEFNRLSQLFGDRGETTDRLIMKAMTGYIDYALSKPRLFDFVFSHIREGARKFPIDFTQGESPTLSIIADGIENAIEDGEYIPDDKWEVALSIWAHIHGLVALYRGGRIALPDNEFRALCNRSLNRLMRGLKIQKNN